MKITVQPVKGFTFNVEENTQEEVAAVRVEWQAKSGGRREHANIVMESSVPAAMLRAAAAYFESVTLSQER